MDKIAYYCATIWATTYPGWYNLLFEVNYIKLFSKGNWAASTIQVRSMY